MIYRSGKKEDVQDIVDLAKEDLVYEARVVHDLKHHPNKLAFDDQGLLGFALSEEVSPEILLIYAVSIRNEQRCDTTGRHLVELIESQAMNLGYQSIMVSGSVQKALLGCESDIVTFAGYKKVYDTGGSQLLIKSIN
jgi:predicted N-acetyltransferase YhbS